VASVAADREGRVNGAASPAVTGGAAAAGTRREQRVSSM
jgi:hypothetical protein